MKQYEKPAFRELGTLEELTQAPTPPSQNKIGPTSDIFTTITNGQVVGSLHSII